MRSARLIPTRDLWRCKDYDEGAETLDGVSYEPLRGVFYLSSETMQGYSANTVGRILRDFKGTDPEVSDVTWARCDYLHAMNTSIHAAVNSGNARLVAKRMAEGADPNSRQKITPNSHYEITPLMRATRQRYHKVARCLLDGGASVDDTDYLDRTALLIAILQRDVKMVRLLIARGAKPCMSHFFTE